jgi:hypothetical protein
MAITAYPDVRNLSEPSEKSVVKKITHLIWRMLHHVKQGRKSVLRVRLLSIQALQEFDGGTWIPYFTKGKS